MDAAQALKLLSSGRDGVMRWNSERPRRAAERPSLAGAELRDLDLTRADLSDLDLSGADLRGSCLRKASLRNVKLGGASLRDCDLRETEFSLAQLRGVDFRGAKLREVELSCLDLGDADFRGADLSFAYLSFSGFEGAKFGEAVLVGADLRDARIAKSQVDAAKTDGQTHLPTSYLPEPEASANNGVSSVAKAGDWEQIELRFTSGQPVSLGDLQALEHCLASLAWVESRIKRPVADREELDRLLGLGDAEMRRARLMAWSAACPLRLAIEPGGAGRWLLSLPSGLFDRCAVLFALERTQNRLAEFEDSSVFAQRLTSLCEHSEIG